mgnify:CR=1 FL=1
MQDHIAELLRTALTQVAAGPFPSLELPDRIGIERTRDASHGDFASNVAMASAKSARANPRQIAEAIVAALPNSPQVEKVEIAGPGFINFFLTSDAATAVVGQVLDAGEAYGRAAAPSGRKVMVEYVSANPNGPLHVGHGRGAALGDCVANLLEAAGHSVGREYYVNDAGRQMDILAASIWVRYLELHQVTVAFPTGGYQGEYVREIARNLEQSHGDRFVHSGAAIVNGIGHDAPAGDKDAFVDALIAKMKTLLGEGFAIVHAAGLDSQLADIRDDLEGFGIVYDRWFSEASLVQDGAVEHALDRLKASGHTAERDGALWLKSSEMGDEKDRVLVKADGAATYYCNDLAYHVDKLDRDWPRLMDVWGADHHGYIARVRAAIEALTGRKDALDVQLIQFVTLSSGRMGKRSGNFVTLQDLIDEVGADATRFFYLMRSHEQHLEFDLDLARSRSNDNPVYYVQYAHARLCSVERQLVEQGGRYERAAGLAALSRLDNEHEKRLMTALARFPEVVRSAAADVAPHRLAFYLKDELADAFHSYYNAHKFLGDDTDLQAARLTLCEATRNVLASGLRLLGVAAPEQM